MTNEKPIHEIVEMMSYGDLEEFHARLVEQMERVKVKAEFVGSIVERLERADFRKEEVKKKLIRKRKIRKDAKNFSIRHILTYYDQVSKLIGPRVGFRKNKYATNNEFNCPLDNGQYLLFPFVEKDQTDIEMLLGPEGEKKIVVAGRGFLLPFTEARIAYTEGFPLVSYVDASRYRRSLVGINRFVFFKEENGLFIREEDFRAHVKYIAKQRKEASV